MPAVIGDVEPLKSKPALYMRFDEGVGVKSNHFGVSSQSQPESFWSLRIAAYYGDIVTIDGRYPTWQKRHFGGVTLGHRNTVHNRRKKRPFSKVPFFA